MGRIHFSVKQTLVHLPLRALFLANFIQIHAQNFSIKLLYFRGKLWLHAMSASTANSSALNQNVYNLLEMPSYEQRTHFNELRHRFSVIIWFWLGFFDGFACLFHSISSEQIGHLLRELFDAVFFLFVHVTYRNSSAWIPNERKNETILPCMSVLSIFHPVYEIIFYAFALGVSVMQFVMVSLGESSGEGCEWAAQINRCCSLSSVIRYTWC